MKPGESVMLDRALRVTFVKQLDEANAIVEFAGSTQVVPVLALSQFEQ